MPNSIVVFPPEHTDSNQLPIAKARRVSPKVMQRRRAFWFFRLGPPANSSIHSSGGRKRMEETRKENHPPYQCSTVAKT